MWLTNAEIDHKTKIVIIPFGAFLATNYLSSFSSWPRKGCPNSSLFRSENIPTSPTNWGNFRCTVSTIIHLACARVFHCLPTRYEAWCCFPRSGVTCKVATTGVYCCDKLLTTLLPTYCYRCWCVDPDKSKITGLSVGAKYWKTRHISKGDILVEECVAFL